MNISIIGAGNVAYHLLQVLSPLHHIVQLYNRSTDSLVALQASFPHITTTSCIGDLLPADLYIIAIKDDQIAAIANQMQVPPNSLVVHTSGTVSSHVLCRHLHYGIFYPLQTMRKQQHVDWENVPICITANTPDEQQLLLQLAQQISSKTYLIDDKQRQMLHLAAIFVNNFTNHLYHIAHHILSEQQLPFELLQPLILETAQKVQLQHPYHSQTGPALRKDRQTIDKHLELLNAQYPQYLSLYQDLSERIWQVYHDET